MARLSERAVSADRQKSRARWSKNSADNLKRQQYRREHKFNERPFVGWDGEGYRAFRVDSTGEVDVIHRYMLFGSSTGDYVVPRNGYELSTMECLDTILRVEAEHPDAFHVGFAFDYDVNMMLKDLPWRMLAVLYDTGQVIWKGYRIRHTPHKTFGVSKGGVSATIYDVFGYFHCSYLKALEKYDIGTKAQIERIKSGKGGRSSFTLDRLAEVVEYWSDEISLLPPLMDKVREAAYDGGFRIREWHGPGALAAYALKHNGINKLHGKGFPAGVRAAIRAAYAGGRFQAWQCGNYDGMVYTADINSAYIYACSLLPRLDIGKWRRQNVDSIKGPDDIANVGLYYIEFDAGTSYDKESRARGVPNVPFPLFHRDSAGGLTWPSKVENWYWSPEARLVAGNRHARITEAWTFDDDGSKPFKWVYDSYNRRVQLQHEGNPAEKAYKWALAAMYGAFARRVGWDKKTRKAPASHELAWAGFITSYCRASVHRAASYAASHRALVSIDTDGVTSTIPFDPKYLIGGVGEGLGQWKLETWHGMFYWQNGIYWYKDEHGNWTEAKSRGIPKGAVSVEAAIRALGDADFSIHPPVHATIRLSRTRFIGYRQALRGQFGKWRHWLTEPVAVLMGGTGKGRHMPPFCRRCRSEKAGQPLDIMHTITHLPPPKVLSEPHKLPWLEPLPEQPANVLLDEIWGDDDL